MSCPSLKGNLGQTIRIEDSTIKLVALFVEDGIDDGHLVLHGVLDGLPARHDLDATDGVVVLHLELIVADGEPANGGDAFRKVALGIDHVFFGAVRRFVFFVRQIVDGGCWHDGDQCLGRCEARNAPLLRGVGGGVVD